jgi:hypothetical protein
VSRTRRHLASAVSGPRHLVKVWGQRRFALANAVNAVALQTQPARDGQWPALAGRRPDLGGQCRPGRRQALGQARAIGVATQRRRVFVAAVDDLVGDAHV